MAIESSTLEQTVERVRNSFRAFIPDSNSWLFPNNLWVSATVLGGLFWEALSVVRKLPDKIMPDTAEDEYLERWANIYGITRIVAAKSYGNVIITGTANTAIPANTTIRTVNNLIFKTLSAATIASTGSVSIAVEADKTGTEYNLAANTPLIIGSTIAGVSSVAVDTTGLSGGACDELDDELRAHTLAAIKSQRRYGTLCDYKAWAIETQGVKRAWVRKGSAVINVLVVLNGATTTQVSDYMNSECRKPLCATIDVFAVTEQALNVSIECAALVNPAIRAQVETALNDYLLDNAVPGGEISATDLQQALCALGLDVTVLGTVYTPTSPLHVFSSVVIS